MINPLSSNLSALRAFGKKMEVTSNNVANVNTEEFKKSRAVLKEGYNGGVEVEISRVDTPGPRVVERSEGQWVEREMSNVELEEEVTQAIMTRRCYEANLDAAKTEDEMLGTLIDILS